VISGRSDGPCCDGDPQDVRGRRFWARTLAGMAVFGCLFVLSGVVFAAVYLIVWACRRG
jgi:hypothetical protein